MSAAELLRFVTQGQGEVSSEEEAQELVQEWSRWDRVPLPEGTPPALGVRCFTAMLTDPARNFIFDRRHAEVYQDMTQPLADYYISSSHNTYLTGNQLTSVASTLAIEFALKRGVRVVELDTYNGKEAGAVVTHGGTVTSDVPFADCVQAVADHA